VSLVCEKGFSITQDEAVKFIKEADERKPPVPTAYQTTPTPTPYSDSRPESEKKTGKLALIAGLAKAGNTESQIAAAVKEEFGPLNRHTTYIVGREWRRVNKVGRHFGSTARVHVKPVNPSENSPAKYVSLAGRSAFIHELRDTGSNWTAAWQKIRAKYPGSSISRCKAIWERLARPSKVANPIN
jgi:hypothetical protein